MQKCNKRLVTTGLVGIVDCNNFYASCEILFRPDLIGRPVIVLSNNDGCVISRSEEAKKAGVQMGVPFHEIENLIQQYQIGVFSSNYTLYGDISARIMSMLRQLVPAVEEYSVDEAFIDLSEMPYHHAAEFCSMVREKIREGVGITVTIGIANTKTLAKVANRYAKKNYREMGVYVLNDEVDIQLALKATPVDDVWGVGRKFAKMLKLDNILTALDLSLVHPGYVKKYMKLPGVRMHNELNGIPCIPLELAPQRKQNILKSRSFGKSLEDPYKIEEAIAHFTARVGEKMREQKSCTSYISVFIETNRFRRDEPQLYNSCRISFDIPTNFTPVLIDAAFQGFDRIYKRGYKIKKAGVMVGDFVPEDQIQTNLFETPDTIENTKMRAVMKLVDSFNNLQGSNLIRFGDQGYKGAWEMRQLRKSENRTTSIHELLVVKIDK